MAIWLKKGLIGDTYDFYSVCARYIGGYAEDNLNPHPRTSRGPLPPHFTLT